MPHDSNVRRLVVADRLQYRVADSLQNAFLEACSYDNARKTPPCNDDNSTTAGRHFGGGTSGLAVERQNTAAMELCRYPRGMSWLLPPATPVNPKATGCDGDNKDVLVCGTSSQADRTMDREWLLGTCNMSGETNGLSSTNRLGECRNVPEARVYEVKDDQLEDYNFKCYDDVVGGPDGITRRRPR